MRVLVTGATGLIGSKLVQSLADKGIEVHCLGRSKIKDPQKGVKSFVWDPYQGQIDIACLEGVDTIIHLAGSSISGSWSAKGKELILSSRIILTAFLVTVLRENTHQVRQVIGASAVGIYADIDELQSEEKYVRAPTFLGDVVEEWERANLGFEQLGITVSLIRIGLVLDDKAGALPEMIRPIRLGVGSAIGRGGQYYSWIHISDLIDIFHHIRHERLGGVYNAVSPSPVTNRVFTTVLGKTLKKPIWMPAIPAGVIRMLLGEKAMLVTEGQRVSSAKLVQTGYVFRFNSLDLALEDLLNK